MNNIAVQDQFEGLDKMAWNVTKEVSPTDT
jgi:hypothetical protein